MSTSAISVTPVPHCTVERQANDRDELLQISRRIDWRFLLPDPDLPATAVMDGADPDLLESLRRIGAQVTILNTAGRADCAGQFRLVVASNPGRDELVRAVQAARCGGYVYVEVQRKRNLIRSTPKSVAAVGVKEWLATLTRLHVTGLQVHWHWPDFRSCAEIIPLSNRAAIRCTLRRRGSALRSQWKTRLAAILLHAGLFESFVPCFSVLGQRFQQEDSSVRPIHTWEK
jgi:hypothetical protein